MAIKKDIEKNQRAIDSPFGFYWDAFGSQLSGIWQATPFRDESNNMAYHRALACWLKDNEIGEWYRRLLLYYYLKPYFQSENAINSLNNLYTVLNTDNLYIERAIRNICILYQKPPKRTFMIGEKEIDEKKAKIINDVLKASGYNTYMAQLYNILKLTNEITSSFVVQIYRGEPVFKWRLYTMDRVRVKYNDFDEPIEFWIHHTRINGDNLEDRFWVWNKEKLILKDSTGKQLSFEYSVGGKTLMVNEVTNMYDWFNYEVLKLSSIVDDTQEVVGGGLWELVRGQLECNKLDRNMDEIVMYSGFNIRGFLDFNYEDDKELVVSPGAVIVKDTPQNEYARTPSTFEIGGDDSYIPLTELKKQKIKGILKNMGLPASVVDDNITLPESGIALQEMRKELMEIRGIDISIMKENERRIIKMMLDVLQNDPASPYKGSFPDYQKYEISIDYAEVDIAMIFADMQLKYDYLLDKNYISPKEHYITFTGDESITDDKELLKLIEENFKQKQRIKGATNEPEIDGVGANLNGGEQTIPENSVGQEIQPIGTETEKRDIIIKK